MLSEKNPGGAPPKHLVEASARIARVSSALAILIGLLVLVGWALDISTLKSILPQYISMKVNTAVCFVLAGVAIALLTRRTPSSWTLVMSSSFSAIVALAGLIVFSQDIMGWDIGIDNMLIREPANTVETIYPGRMAPTTSILFFFLGTALLLMRRRHFWAAQILSALSMLVALFAIVGYLYSVRSFYGIAAYTPMAAHTSVGLLLLSIGTLCLQPSHGLMSIVMGTSVGGMSVRRLLPMTLLLPVLLGWLRLLGETSGLYDARFGLALFALSMSVIFAALILLYGAWLRAIDTRRQHLEEERQRYIALVESANKELESFSYSVSHDLRAPLRAIDGFSRIISEDYAGKLDDEGQRLLGVIVKNTRHMSELIDDLLSFSRIGKKEITREEIDMTALAKAAFEECVADCRQRNVALRLDPLAGYRGDRAMMRQVFVNLIANAVKFTRPRNEAVVAISSDLKNGEITYAIRDNGVGFDMRYAQKLFGVFQRLHGVEEFEGTGVGLAIVQRIVHRHGGRVWAESALGEGSLFSFSFPKEARHDRI